MQERVTMPPCAAPEETPAEAQRSRTGVNLTSPWRLGSTVAARPAADHRGIVFAEDCGQATRRAFCELPILVVN